MDPARAQDVHASLQRCLENKLNGKEFTDAFYETFLASDPQIPVKFAGTDMLRQQELLRTSLVKLIMFASGSAAARLSLDELAVMHDHQHSNIEPEMYDIWLRSLLSTIRRYDLEFSPALEAAWIELLNEGIAVMRKAY